MLDRVTADADDDVRDGAPRSAGGDGRAAPASLEQFLAGIGARAFRFAELGLRQRDDALDAVQDAMMKMLGYRERPPAEWTPLFWSILRSRIVDLQRRRTFRLRWLAPAAATRDDDADRLGRRRARIPRAHHDGREAYARMADALRGVAAAPARGLHPARLRGTGRRRPPRGPWAAAKAR